MVGGQAMHKASMVERTPGLPVLSLFGRDAWNRLWGRGRLSLARRGSGRRRAILGGALLWIPMALLAWVEGVGWREDAAESFAHCFAAHVQFLIAVPILLWAEEVLEKRLTRAPRCFAASGVITEVNRSAFVAIVSRYNRMAAKRWPDICALLMAVVLTQVWFLDEIHNGRSTWIALERGGDEIVTWSGWWDAWVAVPAFQFLVYRWMFKTLWWSAFLIEVSRLRKLRLSPAHPDESGGLGFIADFQNSFGLLLFAVGAFIAATITYKLVIEEADGASLSVWGPAVGFVVLAPLFFMVPLFFYYGRLRALKEEGRRRYGALVAEGLRDYEKRVRNWSPADPLPTYGEGLAAACAYHGAVCRLRLVPLDLRSLGRLFAYAASPMLPLVARLLAQENRWAVDSFERILGF